MRYKLLSEYFVRCTYMVGLMRAHIVEVSRSFGGFWLQLFRESGVKQYRVKLGDNLLPYAFDPSVRFVSLA